MNDQSFLLQVTCGEVEDIIKGYKEIISIYNRYSVSSDDPEVFINSAKDMKERIQYLESMLKVYKK